MKKNKIDRFSHVGKDTFEKEAYNNFLTSKFYLDKTEKDPIDSNKTNESSFAEDESEPTKIKKTSPLLKIKDFFNNNWVITIIGGVILIILTGYISVYREQGIQGQQILTMNSDINSIKSIEQKNSEIIYSLKENFDIFKTATSKDLEYIKKKLRM